MDQTDFPAPVSYFATAWEAYGGGCFFFGFFLFFFFSFFPLLL